MRYPEIVTILFLIAAGLFAIGRGEMFVGIVVIGIASVFLLVLGGMALASKLRRLK